MARTRWTFGLSRAVITEVLRPMVKPTSRPRDLGAIRVGILQREAGGRSRGSRQLLGVVQLVAHLRARKDVEHVSVGAFTSACGLDKQARFFRDSDIVITPHGAQLASIPFMADFGLLVEVLHPWAWDDGYFYGLTQPANIHHARVTDHSIASMSDKPHRERKRIGMSIDHGVLDAVIDTFLRHENRRSKSCGAEVLAVFADSP